MKVTIKEKSLGFDITDDELPKLCRDSMGNILLLLSCCGAYFKGVMFHSRSAEKPYLHEGNNFSRWHLYDGEITLSNE